MPYDTNRTVVDDVDDNLAQYYNEQGTSIGHLMSSVPYSNYGTTTSSSGTITLTDSSFPLQSIAPGTANVVLFMPAVGTANHPFYVVNNGTSGYTIQAETAGSAIIGPPIPANGFAVFISDSTAWLCDGWHDLNDGEMLNGKITPSISSNNLVVTLLTRSGGNPSTTDAVMANINGSYRLITTPLSVTISAGTSTFNAGAVEFAALSVPVFPYLGYITSAGTVAIGVSRISHARVFSTFNGTATNEKYAAFSSTPAATDDVVNIGYFEIINSGTASYNWSAPTFNSANLKQKPTYNSNWLTWAPQLTATAPLTISGTPTLNHARYRINENSFDYSFNYSAITFGGTAGNSIFASLPFAPLRTSALICQVADNGGLQEAGCGLVNASNVRGRRTAGTNFTVAAGAQFISSGKCEI